MAAMIPRTTSPLSMLREMREAMDTLWERGGLTPFSFGRAATYQSPVNVYEDKETYFIQALLPGINPDELQVNAFEGTITIAGEAKPPMPEGARAVWQEFEPFRFQRTVQLASPFEADKIQATYQNGVLLLRVPKAESAKPRTIKIQA